MNKIEHIGIAVKNLEEAKQRFAQLLGSESYKEESVESQPEEKENATEDDKEEFMDNVFWETPG